MLGCIQVLQTQAKKDPEFIDSKHLQIACSLQQLIEAFPPNPEDPTLQEQLSHLRSRFKVLTAGVQVLRDIDAKDVKTLEF